MLNNHFNPFCNSYLIIFQVFSASHIWLCLCAFDVENFSFWYALINHFAFSEALGGNAVAPPAECNLVENLLSNKSVLVFLHKVICPSDLHTDVHSLHHVELQLF